MKTLYPITVSLISGFLAHAGVAGPGEAHFGQATLPHIEDGAWATYEAEPEAVAILGEVDEAAVLAAGFEVRPTPFTGWTTWFIPEGASLAEVEAVTGGAYVAPIIKTEVSDCHVLPKLLVSIDFEGWEATLAGVLASVGPLEKIRILSAPFGTNEPARDYFLGKAVFATPVPVEIGFPDEPEDGSGAPPVPAHLLPPIVEAEVEGWIILALHLSVDNGWEVFDAIAAVEPVAGLNALSPSMMFIGQSSGGIIVPFPKGIILYPMTGTDLGGGWTLVEHFGRVYDAEAPVHFHAEHGYQYGIKGEEGGVWFYNYSSSEWYWTDLGEDPLYPVLWRAEGEGAWLYYSVGSNLPRWFWNYGEDTWQSK